MDHIKTKQMTFYKSTLYDVYGRIIPNILLTRCTSQVNDLQYAEHEPGLRFVRSNFAGSA
jgi:hypothetical protein